MCNIACLRVAHKKRAISVEGEKTKLYIYSWEMKSRSEIFMTAGFSYLFNGPFFSDKSQIVCDFFHKRSNRKEKDERERERGKSYSCSRQSFVQLGNVRVEEEGKFIYAEHYRFYPFSSSLLSTYRLPLFRSLTACATNCNLSCQFKPISQFVNAFFRRVFWLLCNLCDTLHVHVI